MSSEKERELKLQALRKAREQEEQARKRLSQIKYKLIVLSGKGGVGKSFITANLAAALASKGFEVGVLDADVHGPSIPKMFGVHGQAMYAGPAGLLPIVGVGGVRVVSADLMLPDEETALIWRGPLKTGFIRELLSMVAWSPLDFLLVDLPPGTGDEPLTIAQLIKDLSGAIVVTTPSDLTRIIVKKAITFCKQLNVSLLGIVNNMSHFTCPVCGTRHYIFGQAGTSRLVEETGVRVLADIPIDPRINESVENGVPFVLAYPESEASRSLLDLADKVAEILKASPRPKGETSSL
ncbi:Mrp/NBP35 family ATP-binding protein [Infirmifilum lucidum]|uniref:Iron-sulfur cluster carrier protein n=1 Tax=Infirmifilum lucidum TaxID=2776706 RepID=A0A7L9FI41_9CREN|nr:Mrp/NBP35 family ATP-binding protein [Infirmifilum lucidum]QOJ79460.1 Mrp/NBP35 family ATP-binding protein [Infirmifilum lucidum]